MTVSEIEKLLFTRIGFDVHTVGQEAIAATIKQSMRETACDDPGSYARMLVSNLDAWNSLVDRVVIPETWFFRDSEPFKLAADVALSRIRQPSSKVLRILSCPCSTGEEPYSLAIAMLQAGAPAGSFIVDAVDVSRGALQSARAGAFRSKSFRENDLSYRAGYFDQPVENGSWRLSPSVTSSVRFRQENLVVPDFLEDEAPYDLVFCRNLLIYLHAEARLLAMRALRRLVAEDGILVVGHAEAAFAREHGFRPTGHAAAFAFSKPSARIVPKRRAESRATLPLNDPPRPLSVATIGIATPVAPLVPATPSTSEPDLAQLMLARQLGDAGRLHEALRLCGEYLKLVPDSAEGHFLLGVIHDALGHSELAVGSFRKSLYLDPSHRESLLHLALKREAAGDATGAALLRARARRVPEVEQTG